MDSCSLLHRYRDDRRKLLEFMIGLIADVRSTSGSDIDFDAISADYVIQCIHSAGGVLDVSKATTKHIDESMFPTMIHSQTGDLFFLLSEPDSAGSPPRRVPPSVETNHSQRDGLYSSIPPVSSNGLEAIVSGQDFGVNHLYAVPSSSKSTKKTVVPSLGLPALRTVTFKGYRMMTCGNQPMKYCSRALHFLGLQSTLRRIQRKIRALDFLLG